MSEFRDRAEALRTRAVALEPDAAARKSLTEATIAHAEAFLEGLRDGPGYLRPTGSPHLRNLEIGDEGRPLAELLDLVHREIERQGLNAASPRDLAWVPGGGVYVGALGDYLAAVSNVFAGFFPAGPGAVILENRLVRWIASVVGYPENAGGTLTSGGSVAALTAIVAARDSRGLAASDARRAVVYATDQQHFSVQKAVHIAGLSETALRILPVDESYRLVPDEFARRARADRAAGLVPWLVITSAGTTNTGAIDPLRTVSDIARSEGIWHHVDAAYGGFFMLVPARRAALSGIEASDSVVLDPHKSLFLPYGSGAVLVRNPAHLDSLAFRAPYLPEAPQPETSPAEQSVELTKHFRGLRMFLPLLLHGTGAFAAALEEKWWLARYLQDELSGWSGIEVGPEPELSTMCFRIRREGLSNRETDARNRDLLAAVHADGRIFVTATVLNGRFWLRPSIGVFRTHAEHIDELLAILRPLVDRVSK